MNSLCYVYGRTHRNRKIVHLRLLIAERLSTRQIILHRISRRVCMYMYMYVYIYVSRLGMHATRKRKHHAHRNVACWIIDVTSLRVYYSGKIVLQDFIDSIDLCFIQEHWLISEQLHQINNDFFICKCQWYGQFIIACWSAVCWLFYPLSKVPIFLHHSCFCLLK